MKSKNRNKNEQTIEKREIYGNESVLNFTEAFLDFFSCRNFFPCE